MCNHNKGRPSQCEPGPTHVFVGLVRIYMCRAQHKPCEAQTEAVKHSPLSRKNRALESSSPVSIDVDVCRTCLMPLHLCVSVGVAPGRVCQGRLMWTSSSTGNPPSPDESRFQVQRWGGANHEGPKPFKNFLARRTQNVCIW